MKRGHTESSPGFTLVEVMICAVMLGITFMAALGFLSAAWRFTSWNEDKVFAVQKAISVLSEIRSFLETPVTEDDGEGNLLTRNKTVLDLDALDDGVGTSPFLTIAEGVADPLHVLSNNQAMTGTRYDSLRGIEVPWWKFERQIIIRPVYDQGIVVSRDIRLVIVKIFTYRKDGTRAPLAEVGTVLRTTAEAFPTTQVYDVYCVAVDTIPGWWVYTSYVKPFVETCLKDLENRNPGLEVRTHWITKSGYGRDPEYCPFANLATYTTDPVDCVYWYPGTFNPSIVDDVDKYYPPEKIKGRLNVDGTVQNDYDAAENPFPYAIADQWNHCLRYTEAREYFQKRADADLPYHLLLDDMILNPGKYLNAIILNLHGELLPVPPVRNYSDPAKDPVNRPGWRVVTHPEKIWYDNSDPGDADGNGTPDWEDPNNPDAYVNLRVYAWVYPGQGAPYPMANDSNTINPNKRGYYTTALNSHPNTLYPIAGVEYMPGNEANASGGNNTSNNNVPVRLAIEFQDTDGNITPIDLTDTSTFPANCPKPRVWKVEGGFDLTTNANHPNPPTSAPGSPSDGVQDNYYLAECPLYDDMSPGPTGDPIQKSSVAYNGEMYCRLAPQTDTPGESADAGLSTHRSQFGEPRQATVLELFNTPLYCPEICGSNGSSPTWTYTHGGPTFFTAPRGLRNQRNSAGTTFHLYEMEYIPCSTDNTGKWVDQDGDGVYDPGELVWDCVTPFYFMGDGSRDASNPFPQALGSLSHPGFDHGKKPAFARGLYWGRPPDVLLAVGGSTSTGANGTNKLCVNETGWTVSDLASDSHDTRAIAVADLDKDDDLDVVAGNFNNQRKRLYRNNGRGQFTASDIGSDTHKVCDMVLADLNNDGALDIIEGNGQSALINYYYLGTFSDSNGNGFFDPGETWNGFGSGQTISSGTADTQDTRAIAVGDVDNDGWLDIVVGNYGQRNRFLINDRTVSGGLFPSGQNIGSETDNTRGIAVADMNNDTWPDVVVGNWNQTNKIYLNNGAGGFSTPTVLDASAYQTSCIGVADINNDGWMDVVNGISASSASKLYRSNGAGGFVRSDIGATANVSSLALADMNNDGWVDLILGHLGGAPSRLYLNNRSGGFSAPQSLGTSAYNVTAVALGSLYPKPVNTARWIIQIPKTLLAGKGGALRVTTRMGRDLTTGVFWPKEPDAADDITGRNDPANVSRTCTWWVDSPDKVPFSERYQFQGDPRHCPYADLRYNGDTPPATTPFADGYNWYFCDFVEGSNDARNDWGNGFDRNRMLDGWSTNQCEFDVPKYFYWLRSGLIESRSLFTTLTGFSFYYMCMGDEVGYDEANGPDFINGVPITRKVLDGTSGTTYQAQMHQTASPHGVKLIGADYVVDGVRWWSKPWVGEIYPDSLYSAQWRWPEAGEADPPSPRGNLPTGTGNGTFRWVRRGDTCRSGSSYANEGRPFGNQFEYSMRRTQEEGCTSMFNCEMSPNKVFRHHFRAYGSLGTLQPVGEQLARRYYFPIPTQAKISRPFEIKTDYSKPNEWNYYPYNRRNRAKVPDEMTDADGNPSQQTFFDHSNNPHIEQGSAIVRLTAPGTDASGNDIDANGNGIRDDLEKCCYIVVNGIDKTTETGTTFIGKYALLTLVHSYLACGHPNLGPPVDMDIDYRVSQLPRCQILNPTSATEQQNPDTIPVKWKTEWFRWDGMAYTDEYSAAFSQDETTLKYILMYSKDGGETWQYMSDNTNVLPPDGPGLGNHYNDPHQLDDAAVGNEEWEWDVSDTNAFPEGSYLIRIECYRQGCPLHYAYHMEKIYISR